MDQVSRTGIGSDFTDETASIGDFRSSSDEDEVSDPQGQCLASPQVPPPTYKQRSDEFKKLFKELQESERLILDYPCALQRDILLQGRLYLSENCLCFYSNVFRGTKIMLTLRDITSMSREKTARLIPNAIQVCTETEKLFFTSFSAREKSYQGVFRMWQNTLMDKPLTSGELWQMVKQHYGNDLGLSHEEMDSLQVASESTPQHSLTMRPSVEENLGRLERMPSVRLHQVEQEPLQTSTPQGEDMPFPLTLSPNSGSMQEDSRGTSPSHQRSRSPALNRLAPERVSKRSSLSLDLNANLDGLSEQSGSESGPEEDLVEERAFVTQEQGRMYVNRVFHFSAEKMFELLFSDSPFMRRFMKARKITNSRLNPWEREASGAMKRNLNYTITINNPLIGKFSTATENQTLYKESREGHYYLVNAEVYTHDVPYHDYFYTQNQYCIIRNSKRKCRLRIDTDVKYRKEPWSLVKSFITKNSWSGLEDYFKHLESELLKEDAELNQAGGDAGKAGGLRRRRRAYSRTLPGHMKPSKQYGMDPDHHREGGMGPMDIKDQQRWNITTIVAGMSVILLILTVLNLGLFFKLWAMEDVAHRMFLSTKNRLRERSEASLAPDFGARPPTPHRTKEENQLMKAVLQDSINLLEQLRGSLVLLQQNFALANRTATPPQ
ncbi:protein Aster-C isoform X1 [Osmerus mordax]|uniref:protein Aster-C isoform X1 n=1 Tax=Osmerus mordax TaxID=8014 RepID=UPI00351033E7